MKRIILSLLYISCSSYSYSQENGDALAAEWVKLQSKIKSFYSYSKDADTLETYSYYIENGKKIKHGEYVLISNVTKEKGFRSIVVKLYEDGVVKYSINRSES